MLDTGLISPGMNTNFVEQVAGLSALFESWTICERSVAFCALLRRVPTSNLKLLRCAIDAVLAQNFNPEEYRQECDANDPIFLTNILKGSDDEGDPNVTCRLIKVLSHLPLLRPGNTQAKDIYLHYIPLIVRQCCALGPSSHQLDQCQQMLSYLLIHPAFDQTDRRSLSQLLRVVENHANVHNKIKMDIWQQPDLIQQPTNRSIWSHNTNNSSSQLFRRTIGKNVEFKPSLEQIVSNESEPISSLSSDTGHDSFSKNGTDMDLSSDIDRVPFDPVIIQPKAGRSNSLTPPSSSCVLSSSSPESIMSDPNFVQKPRSFSLSSEQSLLNMRALMNLSANGSDTPKLDNLKFSGSGDHGGMSTIAHWLKTLRLHKYVWVFSNLSYDEMMAVDEDFLEKLGVTKGARHKLLLSIKKLSERQTILEDLEKELSSGSFISLAAMTTILEQLRGIVVSPIKPESILATLVVRVLDLSSSRLLSNGSSYVDGGGVIALHCWLVERALAHDAFSGSAALAAELKALKYRVPPRQFLAHLGDAPFRRRQKQRWRTPGMSNSWQRGAPLVRGGSRGGGRKGSYPPFPPPGPLAPASSLGDINSRLESLCLQMTEQAID